MRIAFGEFIFALLCAALLSIAWWLVRQGFLGAGQVYFIEAAVLGFTATAIFITFGIVSDRILVPAFVIGISFVSAWFILLESSSLGVAAVIVSFLLSSTAWIRMRQQRSLLLNPSFSSAAHAGLGLWFLGIALLLAVGSYLGLPNQETLIKKIPETFVGASLPFVARPLEQFTGVNLNTTIDEFISKKQDVKDLKKIAQAREQFAAQVGVPLSGDQRLRDVIQSLIEQKIRTLFSVFGKYLIFGFVLVFVLFSQSIAAPSVWALALLGPVILKVVRGIGFVEEEQHNVVRSMLRWRVPKK